MIFKLPSLFKEGLGVVNDLYPHNCSRSPELRTTRS